MVDPGWVNYVPFVGLAINGDNPKNRPILTRLLEAVIIGAVAMYGTTKVLEERIENIARTQLEIKQEIRQIRNDFYRPAIPQ